MIKKIIKYISNIVLYTFAITTFVLLIMSLIGIKPYITISGSMEPNIMTGSICFVNTKEKYDNIKVDDVIAFKTNNMLITHRVLNVSPDGIQTKGDNNEEPDNIITDKTNFVGKTLFSIPLIGYIVMFFKTPIGLSVIGAILLILVLSNIKSLFKPKDDELKNNEKLIYPKTTANFK